MNKIILMGRLTTDPEIRATNKENGKAANFTIAVQRPWVKQDAGNEVQKADFLRCSGFGKTAEFIEKYVKKGNRYVVEGRMQSGSYTNAEGQKVYTTEVVIEKIEFADSKPTDNGQAPQGYMAPPAGQAPQGYMAPPTGQAPQGYMAPPTGQAPQGYMAPPTGQTPQGYMAPPQGFTNLNGQEELPFH